PTRTDGVVKNRLGERNARLSPISSFFFSSRRRHTRCYRDWSSDVCSSDLALPNGSKTRGNCIPEALSRSAKRGRIPVGRKRPIRSEERRVGKECRSGWSG